MELPATERRSACARALDLLSPVELAEAFARADREAADAVAAAGPEVARGIELARDALAAGGRVLLTGAGTSGRLAVIEASECWPTFSSDRVVGFMAGGSQAFLRAKEGAEDDRAAGAAELNALSPSSADLLIGIAASGQTPFVFGALQAARTTGARTAMISCSPPSEPELLDLSIVLGTGPELLSGSTRLKAGTATKMVLNAITTGSMSLLGKVMDDLMVDVVPSNAKLVVRARRIVATLTGGTEDEAQALLESSGEEVKTAVVMGRLGLDASAARARLSAAAGHLRRALETDRLDSRGAPPPTLPPPPPAEGAP